MRHERYYAPALWLLLAACVARFWLPLLFESFWIDETLTAFVVRHGANHRSLAAAPGLSQSIYYWLPRISESLLGWSEFSLRLPSLLLTLGSLVLIWKIARQLIHNDAGWIAVFLCFIPHEFTRQATDARPYGLGTFLALLAIWLLIRGSRYLFIVPAALLIYVQLIYWPFYAVFFRRRREMLIVLACAAPMIPATLALFHNAGIHVVTPMPTVGTVISGFQIPLIAAVGIGAWLLHRKTNPIATPSSDRILLLIWCFWPPFCLLAVSLITHNSVFLPRYFSLALPGAILLAIWLASLSIPVHWWKPAALVLAIGILASRHPAMRNSHWREAAIAVNNLAAGAPVICPSPFIEAQPPLWKPDYKLPGFFYAHLDAYPIHQPTILLPARLSPEGETLIRNATLPDRVIIYGGVYSVNLWAQRLSGWHAHQAGSFGDVQVLELSRESVR